MTVVKFPSKKTAPDPVKGPHWAGRPIQEAFPRLKVRTPAQVQSRKLIIFEGELCFLEDEGPEGAA